MPIIFLNKESTQLEVENKGVPDENDVKMIEDENGDYSKKSKEKILDNKISMTMVKGTGALGYHETCGLGRCCKR